MEGGWRRRRRRRRRRGEDEMRAGLAGLVVDTTGGESICGCV